MILTSSTKNFCNLPGAQGDQQWKTKMCDLLHYHVIGKKTAFQILSLRWQTVMALGQSWDCHHLWWVPSTNPYSSSQATLLKVQLSLSFAFLGLACIPRTKVLLKLIECYMSKYLFFFFLSVPKWFTSVGPSPLHYLALYFLTKLAVLWY